MEPIDHLVDPQVDCLDLLKQLLRDCPDAALHMFQTQTRDNAIAQLAKLKDVTTAEKLLSEIVATGAVLAGSFVLHAFYGRFSSNTVQNGYGDLDIWIDVADTVKGDPRQLLPSDHVVRSLSWSEDAAEISRFYGCFPLPFPYIADQSTPDWTGVNAARLYHPVLPVLMRMWWLAAYQRDLEAIEKASKDLKSLDDMIRVLERTSRGSASYRSSLYSCGLAMWGDRPEEEPYVPSNFEFDNYKESITNSFNKANKGIVSSRSFEMNSANYTSHLTVQLHIVDTQGMGLQSWIERVFDQNLCGAVQINKQGVYVREPRRILPMLLSKTMFHTSKSRQLDWTPLKRDRVLLALHEDEARVLQAQEGLLSTRLGSVNVLKANETEETFFPVLFEWAKAVLLPPVREGRRSVTMEELYERMATVKLHRIQKYQKRGFSWYYPGIALTSEDILEILQQCQARGATTLLDKCREIFGVFQNTVDATVLDRFIALVATEPTRPNNGTGTGPTYFF